MPNTSSSPAPYGPTVTFVPMSRLVATRTRSGSMRKRVEVRPADAGSTSMVISPPVEYSWPPRTGGVSSAPCAATTGRPASASTVARRTNPIRRARLGPTRVSDAMLLSPVTKGAENRDPQEMPEDTWLGP